MDRLEVGQVLEFVEDTKIDGRTIESGTRVRVGYVESELFESKVIVVVLGADPPQTLTMPRHVLTLHAQLVTNQA